MSEFLFPVLLLSLTLMSAARSVVQAMRGGAAAIADPWGLALGLVLIPAVVLMTYSSPVLQIFAGAMVVFAAENLVRGGIAYGLSARSAMDPGSVATSAGLQSGRSGGSK